MSTKGRPGGRVLFPYVGDTVGGSHVSSLTLVRALADTPWTPVVGLHQQDGRLAEYLDTLGQEWISLPDLPLPTMGSLRRQIPVFTKAMRPLKRLLQADSVDIVHTNDIRMHQLWGLPARIAFSAHFWHQRTPTRAPRLDTYARLASRVVTISDYCRSQLPPRLARKAEVITNPFEMNAPPERSRYRSRRGRRGCCSHRRSPPGSSSERIGLRRQAVRSRSTAPQPAVPRPTQVCPPPG